VNFYTSRCVKSNKIIFIYLNSYCETNLFYTIKLDLIERGFKLECFNDLYVVRDRAKKRTERKELF
jgi:hypothetical protein